MKQLLTSFQIFFCKIIRILENFLCFCSFTKTKYICQNLLINSMKNSKTTNLCVNLLNTGNFNKFGRRNKI